jgi:ABC-type glutathione transport system ATPase component
MLSVSINKVISNRRNTQTVLLTNTEFELKANQIYTVIGRNGAGKSTFIKTVTDLLDKRFYTVHGQVLFDGIDLLHLNKETLNQIRKGKIKYVFQDAKNSFDQLKTFKYYFGILNAPATEIDDMLAYMLLPNSNSLFNLHPYEVSGGMAQRISLALALLAHPSLIILDEPTSGVDSAIANLFLLKLKEFVKEASNSVLLVTQDLSFANMVSDKISLLSNGSLSEFLSPEEFFRMSNNLSKDEIINSHLQINK